MENHDAPMEERIQPPVEKWLRGFYDADFVITDRGWANYCGIISVKKLRDFLICFIEALNDFFLERTIAECYIHESLECSESFEVSTVANAFIYC